MAMRKRNWQVGAAVVAGLAALQSPLMLPAGLVLLGRWVYLDTAARGVRNPIALAIIMPEVVGIILLIALPAVLALGVGMLLRKPTTEVGPTGSCTGVTPGSID